MKKYYVKTNCNYLIYSMIIFILITIFLILTYSSGRSFLKIVMVDAVVYLLLIIRCGCNSIRHRRVMDEVLSSGRCYQGTVKELIEVQYETTYSRAGTKFTTSIYQIKAEVVDEYGTSSLFCSEFINKRGLRSLSSNVKIYRYLDHTYMIWDKPRTKENFKVKSKNITQPGEASRMILRTLNEITSIAIAFFVVGICYLSIFVDGR